MRSTVAVHSPEGLLIPASSRLCPAPVAPANARKQLLPRRPWHHPQCSGHLARGAASPAASGRPQLADADADANNYARHAQPTAWQRQRRCCCSCAAVARALQHGGGRELQLSQLPRSGASMRKPRWCLHPCIELATLPCALNVSERALPHPLPSLPCASERAPPPSTLHPSTAADDVGVLDSSAHRATRHPRLPSNQRCVLCGRGCLAARVLGPAPRRLLWPLPRAACGHLLVSVRVCVCLTVHLAAGRVQRGSSRDCFAWHTVSVLFLASPALPLACRLLM